MDPTPVRAFYAKKNIFVTGATGFVGIALVEKILRDVRDVEAIYVLIRPKKGKTIEERLEELKSNSGFDLFRKAGKEYILDKIIAVSGDVGEENLGLKEEDRKMLLEKMNVVFHCAATLDFEATLSTSIRINLLGTRRVVELCQGAKNLNALVHVSSAYVNAVMKTTVEEKIYEAPGDAEDLIKKLIELSESAVDKMEKKVIGKHPNCYTFTKALAEHEIRNANNNTQANPINAVIIRPSMINGAWKEPVPGWTISKNGPQGFLMGAAKGVVRRLPINNKLVYDYIPVDIVVNQMIVGAWVAAMDENGREEGDPPVYHCTTSTYKPFKWCAIEPQMNDVLHTHPLKSAVWYPYLKFLPSLLLFRISAIFFHLLPALVLDAVTKLSGGRPILVRMHRNINKSLGRLAPFIFNEWFFENHEALKVFDRLSVEDKKLFRIDVFSLEWDLYMKNLALGVRKYLNRESVDTLESARRKDRLLKWLNYFLQGAIVAAWIYVTMCITGWDKYECMIVLAPILYAFNRFF